MAKKGADIESAGEVPARWALGYRVAFVESVSVNDVREIIKAVVARAKEGDLASTSDTRSCTRR